MNGRHQALESLYNEKIRQLPKLQRYGRHYTDFLLGKLKEPIILNLKKQLFPLPPALVENVELLAERNIQCKLENQELNLLESNMFADRCKHLYNKSYWYIHEYHRSKDLSAFFYYLRTYISHPPTHHEKKSSRILASRLAEEMVNAYFQKAVDTVPTIKEVNLFEYRLEICAWEIANMFLKTKTQGILSLADHFNHIKETEKDKMIAFWQSAINVVINGNNSAGTSMQLEFLYIDFIKDATITSDNLKLACLIKTALPLLLDVNTSRFIEICSSILPQKLTKEICSYFHEAGLLTLQ